MAYFEYTAGRRSAGQPGTIEIVGTSEKDIQSERHDLINAAMNAVLRREFDTKERAALATADYKELPADLVSRLIEPEVYDPPVTQAGTGLAMYVPEGEGASSFALLTEEIDDDFELVELRDDGVDPDTFNHLIERKSISRSAIQHQPVRDAGRFVLRAHKSFGEESIGGNYVPIVTVLSAGHGVRQLIET